MPLIVQSEIGENHIRLDVTFPKSEVSEIFKKALKKEQKKSNLKGFRKGKAPITTLRKMYGTPILAQSIFDELNHSLGDYIENENIQRIGDPLPVDEAAAPEFNAKNLEEYSFAFEMGSYPEVDIHSVLNEKEWDYYEAEISEAEIDEQISQWQDSLGTLESKDSVGADDDLLSLELMELDEEGEIKKDGVFSNIKIKLNSFEDGELKEQLRQVKLGDEINFNIYDMNSNFTEDHLRKNILKIEDDLEFNPEFKAGIEDIESLLPAEINEDFYERIFGADSIESEEDMRNKTRGFLQKNQKFNSDTLLYLDFMPQLDKMSENISLPRNYFKRLATKDDDTITISENMLDEFIASFQMQIMQNRIKEHLDAFADDSDIIARLRNQVYEYGISDPEQVESLVRRFLENEQVVERIKIDVENQKMMSKIADQVPKVIHMVNKETLKDMLDKKVKKHEEKQKEGSTVTHEEE